VQRSDGPFDDLLQALRTRTISNPSHVCPAVAAAPLLLILTDAAGHTVIPAVPATECDLPDPAAQDAID
jgi:hypothetical protein